MTKQVVWFDAGDKVRLLNDNRPMTVLYSTYKEPYYTKEAYEGIEKRKPSDIIVIARYDHDGQEVRKHQTEFTHYEQITSTKV